MSTNIFTKEYYDGIWKEGIHRHDYCESVATQLIQKYGKVRFLDIGTGCGYLVKTLRDKGASAYGIEISQYAVDNSHGNVIQAPITSIPFSDNSFDVVHSQGVWEYVKEEDIQKAWAECSRVGKLQEHNIDVVGSELGEEDFATARSREWWDEHLILPKILVACPNHEVKEYSFQRWIDNVKSLTYPNYDLLVIDNSPTEDFMNRWKDQVPMRRIDTRGIEPLMVLRINLSYEEIRKEFLAGPYERLMIIESDVIPQKDVIETMLKWGKDTDWISHAYPSRGEEAQEIQGIGCSLFTRQLMEKHNFKTLGDNYLPDGGMWLRVRPDKSLQTLEMWNYITIDHLKE